MSKLITDISKINSDQLIKIGGSKRYLGYIKRKKKKKEMEEKFL